MKYEFHHLGIPVNDGECIGRFSKAAGMYTSDNQGHFRIQWHRFTTDSPLHPLIKAVPHIAFKVELLSEAIEGYEVLLGPYEPLEGYFVAIINDCGVPVEFIQTTLTDEELWLLARSGNGGLYQSGN